MPPSPQPPAGFAALAARHPWPSAPPFPGVEPTGRVPRGLGLAREVLDRLVASGREAPVVLEIGAELGGSTRAFLASPRVHVVSVDPWPDGKRFRDFPTLRRFRDETDASLRLFWTFTFAHRDRLVAVREASPRGPVAVHDAGVEVDLVYIDGDHTFEAVLRDLEVCAALFPRAVLTGDDWLFDPTRRPRYEDVALPVQTAVRRFAQRYDVGVRSRSNTWLIDPTQPYDLPRLGPAGPRSALQDAD